MTKSRRKFTAEQKAAIGSTLDFKNTYSFDTLQRLVDIVQQGQSGGNAVTAKHITQSFNALSQRTQIARYQSTGTSNAVATTDFTFDSGNRLSGIAHEQGATDLNTYAYTYDALSRIVTIVSTLEGTDTYTYDQTSQLVGATHTSHSNETYGFDANGNRNTSGFTTGDNNQTTAGLGFTYTFDDEGNRITKTETSTGKIEEYTWDHRNRLTKVVFRNSSGGSIVKQVEYEYDAYNRMVRRTYDADGAGGGAATNQYWVYDEGINALLEFDGASGSDLAHRYLWSNSVDELLADEVVTSLGSGGNVLWALSDHLGSIRDIADYSESTGVTSVANHRTWSSFGKLISESNAAVDLFFGFTGKQFDEATGLQHNLFRWLDPALGQWLSEDPIGFSAGDENVRRYVGNGVTNGKDGTGLQQDPPPEQGNGPPARDPTDSYVEYMRKVSDYHLSEARKKVMETIEQTEAYQSIMDKVQAIKKRIPMPRILNPIHAVEKSRDYLDEVRKRSKGLKYEYKLDFQPTYDSGPDPNEFHPFGKTEDHARKPGWSVRGGINFRW